MKKSVLRKVERMMKKDGSLKLKLLVKLDQMTTEYKALEEEKTKYYKDNFNKVTSRVIQVLHLKQAHISSLESSIVHIVDTLKALQIAFNNDVAQCIYNETKKSK